MSEILVTQNLTKNFGGIRAVSELDLKIKKGEIHSLIGPNGSGKSTTLNLLNGIYLPSSGHILFNGKEIEQLPVFKRTELGIGRTFQNIRLFNSLTVYDNVLAGLHCRLSIGSIWEVLGTAEARKQKKDSQDRIYQLCKMVGLDGKEHIPASSLSYGERRMLEIARALASKPTLLLLDEPFAGMSPNDADHLIEIIKEINHSGLTIFLVEHHMKVVMQLSHSISVLNFGTKIAEGPPDEIRRNPEVIEAYLGKEGQDA